MRYLKPLAFFCLLAVLGGGPSLYAQSTTLKSGTWTGEIIPPDGQIQNVTYDVIHTSDSLAINLVVPALGTIPFEDIKLEADTLNFSWQAGAYLRCNLILQENGSYDGECGDVQGISGVITMVPPQEKADS